MIEHLLSHLPSIWTVLTGLLGGGTVAGLLKLYRTYWTQHRKNEAQDAELRNDRVKAQAKRLDQLHDRLVTVEKKQEEERKARVEAEVENKRLRAMVGALRDKIDQLIAMVQDLRDEAGMEPLTDEEKEDLKNTPNFISNNHSENEAPPQSTSG